MPKTRTAIGVDIGAHALKAVVLRKTGSHVSLARAGAIDLGDLAFLDDSERKNLRLAELLRFLLRQGRIRGRTVANGLAGRSYFVKYLHVPPATPDKLRKLIDYEVTEDPTAPSEQTADFVLLDLPGQTDEFTILVAMARNDALRRRLALLKQAGLGANGVTLNAIGLFNTYTHAQDEEIYNDKTTLLVDLGGRHLDVVVQRNAKILFVRNLTLGGVQFSEALQEEYELPIKEAEELKLTQGAIIPGHFDVAAEIDTSNPEARLSAALLEPAESLYNTLQATIKYCQTQTRMTDLRIDEIVLGGGAARLRGLREFLSHRFHLPVHTLDPIAHIDTSALPAACRDDVTRDAGTYAVAIGLALRQLDDRAIKPITLLPADVSRRREFLTRDAFVYAAATVFLLTFGTMFYSSRHALARAASHLKTLSKRISDAEAKVGDFDHHASRNQMLARQARTLKRLLDTGRRCAEAIAALKQRLPPQLRIDSIATESQRPTFRPTRSGAKPQKTELATQLLIRGAVAESHKGRKIGLAEAQDLVNSFLKELQKEEALYGHVKVTKYPAPQETPDQRTFKMTVTFAAPFYGGIAMDPSKQK